ncbi:MAG TPA: orotidine-5'-phosphate decarboxylase [Gammaproteobacteria bacterium]|nr:orotidine-5'-phosphate decarboxylase [Gammaproteobacteria bacterium]
MSTDSPIIVALDFAEPDRASALAQNLDPAACRLKVGKELFTRGGPDLVKGLVGAGFDVFLDLKFHDIPTTVAKACRAAADLGVWMINVHALGGRAMLACAREAVDAGGHRPLLIAVTVLTSHSDEAIREVGLSGTVRDNVLRLSQLAAQCAVDGVVCSPRETRLLRATHGPGYRLVTPGIRPAGAQAHDQTRTATPAEALANGADYLVIGRPITQAPDPMAALRVIQAEIDSRKPSD